ncbi:MAG: LysM domain-containing protein [Solidesulfovibrio magneticus str. Maddingley MBC34]|uniref:LysM domain-containing protein n=1 Tax=Solidesulfovibrio magneticus str. Maddingley MBC34 TaxID=1206767 RepID=K6GQ17_9BACT|nr:MAG: LysM domain-containing protein [Solidesulfovibrio magneticus str. Maddingley MBC34]
MKSRIATLVVLTAGLALAGCSKEDPTGFPKVDYNKDGRVIFEELIVVFPDLTVEEFLAADADGNGTLSEQEYNRFREARKAGKKLDAAAPPAPAAKPAEAPAPKPAEPAAPAPAPAKAAEPAPATPAVAPAPAAPSAASAPAAPPSASAPAAPEVVETVVAEPPAPAPAPAPAAKPAASSEKPASPATKSAAGAAKAAAAGGTTHTVARGDTLTRLAKKYGVSTQAIMEANGMKDADHLQLGKTLTIPAAAQ